VAERHFTQDDVFLMRTCFPALEHMGDEETMKRREKLMKTIADILSFCPCGSSGRTGDEEEVGDGKDKQPLGIGGNFAARHHHEGQHHHRKGDEK